MAGDWKRIPKGENFEYDHAMIVGRLLTSEPKKRGKGFVNVEYYFENLKYVRKRKNIIVMVEKDENAIDPSIVRVTFYSLGLKTGCVYGYLGKKDDDGFTPFFDRYHNYIGLIREDLVTIDEVKEFEEKEP